MRSGLLGGESLGIGLSFVLGGESLGIGLSFVLGGQNFDGILISLVGRFLAKFLKLMLRENCIQLA